MSAELHLSNVVGRGWSALSPTSLRLPFVLSPSPSAGFPSPAQDYVEDTLDLRELLVSNPPATFFVRVDGDSLRDLGILTGDILVVDRSLTARPGQVVVASWDGDFYVKILRRMAGVLVLASENAAEADRYPAMPIDGQHDCEIFGVVTGVVRKL